MHVSAPADARGCEHASWALACIRVICGCMCLLSLTATCQVGTVSLKAGQSTYNGHAPDWHSANLNQGDEYRDTRTKGHLI
jgi:hypothetical protein